MLEAGADAVTKFPSIRLFNSKYAKQIEKEVRKAKRSFSGTLTRMKKIDMDEIDVIIKKSGLNRKIKNKLKNYIQRLEK